MQSIFRAFCGMLAVLFAFMSSGCYNWVDIRPTELTKLNGSYSRVTGVVPVANGTVTTVERTVAHVERPDGTLVEIKGDFDAEITLATGQMRIKHPVGTSLGQGVLIVQGGDLPPTPFPLQDIQSVRVSQFNAAATGVLAAGLGAVAGVLLFVALTSSASSH